MSSRTSTTPSLLTLAVPPGTGTIKSALLALTTGSSMLMESVFQFLISVPPMLKTEIVNLATKDTILRKESVSSLNSTMLSLLTLDVPPGIGIIKSALPVLTIGSSMPMEFALQYPTNAENTLKMEIVLNALRDTT